MSATATITAMIVDDSFFMCNLLRSIIEWEGYSVVAEAANGKEAVAMYRDCRPDLVLMDIIMPVMNGIEATREIVANDPGARVVVCSMAGHEGLLRSACEAGACGVITKPFTSEEVLTAMGKALNAGRRKRRRGEELLSVGGAPL